MRKHLASQKKGPKRRRTIREPARQKDPKSKTLDDEHEEVGKGPKRSNFGNGSAGDASSPSSSEHSDVTAPYDDYGHSSMFDHLLKTLGSSNQKLATLYRKRLREQEGRSDSEEEEGNISASTSLSEGEDADGGFFSKSDLADEEGNDLVGNELAGHLEQSEEDHTGEEDDASDGNEVDDMDSINERESLSSFQRHLQCILTKEEVEKIRKQKWKYQWEIPAVNMQMSKWVGTGEPISEAFGSNTDCDLKEKLYNHCLNIYETSGSSNFNSTRESFYFSLFSTYRDIMHCNKKPFYVKGSEEDSSIMDAYILHALNHVYRTRDLVIKNDANLSKLEDKREEILRADAYLDQGFTRPKVLFLLPFRSIALRVVKRLTQLTPLSNKDNVEHFGRFTEEFGVEDGDVDDGKNANSESQKRAKPTDFQVLFGGNNDDHFMLGLKFTKRTIKLYSDFYSSDIIVASPLGLITKIGEAESEKGKDVDYLSSIEVVIIDHADVMDMQNWSHVNTVLENLNKTPSKLHGTNMMRIRPWYLDGHARFYRQTILLGSYLNPDMNALFHRQCINYEGKVKLVTEYKGVLPKILLKVRQVYERFGASSIVDADDARLDCFCKKVFPKIKDSIEGGLLLFISSYFEFVRIRNFLKSQNASFCLLGEYTKQSDISRARIWFFEGKRKIMLYTERAHFYHRYKIRGIQSLIIYSLPERKEFYPEIINMLDGSRNMMCTVMFSRCDLLKLERIVGTSAAKRMLSSDKNMFVFC